MKTPRPEKALDPMERLRSRLERGKSLIVVRFPEFSRRFLARLECLVRTPVRTLLWFFGAVVFFPIP